MSRFALLFLALTFTALASLDRPPRAEGAVIQVTTTSNIVSNDGQCGLREAVTAANTNAAFNGCTSGQAGQDIIAVPDGNYLFTGAAFDIMESLIVSGESQDATFVTRFGGSGRIFTATGFANLTLERMTLSNGNADGNGNDGLGGAVYAEGDLTLDHVTVTGNDAKGGGGGIYLAGGSASDDLIIRNSLIQNNRVTDTGGSEGGGVASTTNTTIEDSVIQGNGEGDAPFAGGGVFVGNANGPRQLVITNTTITDNESNASAGLDVSVTAELTNVTITNNRAAFFGGGAVFNNEEITFSDGEISGNTAANGGSGLYNAAITTIEDSVIADNGAADTGGGGGITNASNFIVASLTVVDSTISGNMAHIEAGGGGIWNRPDEMVTLINVTLDQNSAGNGGGVFNEGMMIVDSSRITGNQATNGNGGGADNLGDLTILQTTLFANTATLKGGGLHAGDGQSSVEQSTFNGNAAPDGSAVQAEAAADITNSTIADNVDAGTAALVAAVGADVTLLNVTLTANGGAGISNAGEVTARNMIIAEGAPNCTGTPPFFFGASVEDADDCGLAGAGDKPNTDPLLGPLADNGGLTQTRALLANSPAIDAAPLANCPSIDQRGQPRPQGNGCDSGAYESSASSVTPSPTASPQTIQGDVNCSGIVDEDDFLLLVQYAAQLFNGLTPGPCLNFGDLEPASGFPWADVNCDGVVDIVDALFVVAYLANIHLPQAVGNCFDLGSVFT